MKSAPDGQYMKLPPSGGWLEVSVYSGLWGFRVGKASSAILPHFNVPFPGAIGNLDDECANSLSELRWILYKAPRLDIVSAGAKYDVAASDDVEHRCWVTRGAKETLDIDTRVGTSAKILPMSRGQLRDTQLNPVNELVRAGRTDRPERLWIGSLYSQYAERHTTLTGDAHLDAGSLCPFTEANQGERVFMITAEEQDVIADTSTCTFAELSEDEYEAEIFES
jgi:hypothetical protein